MELERKQKREVIEEKVKARYEVTGNGKKGGQTQVAVAVKITRKREVSTRLVTKEGEDGNLRMRDAEAAKGIIGLETSQNATTDGSDNNPLYCRNFDITEITHALYA